MPSNGMGEALAGGVASPQTKKPFYRGKLDVGAKAVMARLVAKAKAAAERAETASPEPVKEEGTGALTVRTSNGLAALAFATAAVAGPAFVGLTVSGAVPAVALRCAAAVAAGVTGTAAVAPEATPLTSVMHSRLTFPEANWRHATLRSAVESLLFLASVAVFRFALDGAGADLPLAAASLLGGGIFTLITLSLVHLWLAAVDGPPKAPHAVNTDPTLVWREEEGVSVLVPAVFTNAAAAATARTNITMEELARHHTRDDAWICVEGRAYDVTPYIEKHPGGWLPIVDLAGKDVTDAFANYHPARVYEKLLPSYYIGDITDYAVSTFVSEHRALRQELLRTNQFESKWGYYFYLLSWLACILGTALYLSLGCSSVTAHMAGAAFIALFWQQTALLGHDIGHNSLTHVRSWDYWLAVAVLNPVVGISMAWWKRSHNVHHVVCNSIENDPDIQHMPALAVDEGIFGKFWSTYHRHWVVTDAVARFLVSWQHIIFFPALAVGRFNMYAQFVQLLASDQKVEMKGGEIAGLGAFWILFGTLCTVTTSTWGEWWAYLLLAHALSGVLHVQIVLSHFAEEVYHGMPYNDDADEWFTMQVRTSLNVDCPTWMDWFHGGLQFQVEHHLYPRLPRHNLRACRDHVKALCAKHDIPYMERDWFTCIARVVSKMYATALKARTLTQGDAGYYESALRHGLDAIG